MKKITMALLSVTAFLFSTTAHAELLVDPTASTESGEISGGVSLIISSVAYELDGSSSKSDVDRKILSAYGALNVQDEIDVFGALGYTFEAEADDVNGDDTGFMLAGGVRGTLPIEGDFKVQGYAQLLYFDEDYGNLNNTASVSGSGIELSVGAVAVKELDALNIYGGIELIPYNDVEFDFSNPTNRTIGADRDDIFGIRLGANYQLDDQFLLRGEVALLSETTFTLGVSMPF